jgi:hypothetical protein
MSVRLPLPNVVLPMGVPQLADWMKQHPAERVAAWRGVIDKHDGEEA